ncbi:MAG: flagellar export protein FliJ [Treponema sp.]|nr:flagellar export protein FliJ [Treponema sp.]
MTRFHFPLEKVLELREHREQETEIALGRAIGELVNIENRIKETASLIIKARDERRNPGPDLPGGLADLYRYHEFYIRRLEQTKEKLLQEAAEARIKVEEARELFLEASRERKVLDKLKEKRAGEYRKTMLAAETKMLDGLNSARYARVEP